jgi:hypothetical protein
MSDAPNTAPVRREIYVPGYRWAKLSMAVFGLLLFSLSLTKLGTVFRLMVHGERARAEVVRVVLVDAAGQETPLVQPVDVLDAEKRLTDAKDRTISFWMEYRYTHTDGRAIEVRSPIGCQLKPLHPYRDADGLPATIKLWYDPAHPQTVVIPFQFLPGTWFPFGFGTFFIPGMFFLFGLAGFGMGLLLWWQANKPIELPDLSQAHGELDKKTAH